MSKWKIRWLCMYLLTLWLSRLVQNSFLSQCLPYIIPSVDLWIQSFHIITISSIVHMPLRFCHSNWLYFSMKCFLKLQIVTIHELYPVSGLHPIFSINTCLLNCPYFCQWVCEKNCKNVNKKQQTYNPSVTRDKVYHKHEDMSDKRKQNCWQRTNKRDM